VQRAAVVALFDRPSRRCTELRSEIKLPCGVRSGDVVISNNPVACFQARGLPLATIDAVLE
jgi:hypothetical protein